MKKLFATLSAVCLVGALTGANVWAADPDTSVIDRHAVWTKTIEENQTKASDANKQARGKDATEDHAKMEVRIKDLPWQRVG